jgi:hypothetical protein
MMEAQNERNWLFISSCQICVCLFYLVDALFCSKFLRRKGSVQAGSLEGSRHAQLLANNISEDGKNEATKNQEDTERGSPSLVGRGIANPEDEIDEIQGKYKGEKRGEWEFRSILRNFEPTCPFGHEVSNFREKELENHLKLQKNF